MIIIKKEQIKRKFLKNSFLIILFVLISCRGRVDTYYNTMDLKTLDLKYEPYLEGQSKVKLTSRKSNSLVFEVDYMSTKTNLIFIKNRKNEYFNKFKFKYNKFKKIDSETLFTYETIIRNDTIFSLIKENDTIKIINIFLNKEIISFKPNNLETTLKDIAKWSTNEFKKNDYSISYYKLFEKKECIRNDIFFKNNKLDIEFSDGVNLCLCDNFFQVFPFLVESHLIIEIK